MIATENYMMVWINKWGQNCKMEFNAKTSHFEDKGEYREIQMETQMKSKKTGKAEEKNIWEC